MNISARWLNDYLDPPASPDEQAELLTQAGFPLEEREDVADVPGGDVRLDLEMTSNRGDCTCHVGLAREAAAISGRSLKPPEASPKPTGPAASGLISVENREPDRCPLYTARIIRGITVGPSPAWLADRLRARGDIPRNNVVDATNFVLFELGQPTHVFDLAELRGNAIIIRNAEADEPFQPIGEGAQEIALHADDLVIADAERAVALAGVKGGALTAVRDTTTDILIEAATFDPVAVRNTSRRHSIASDSSYRFERGVHPGQVNAAADRLAAIILELAGGELCEGVVADGSPMPEPRTVTMRTARCRQLLGIDVSDERMIDSLGRLGFQPRTHDGVIACTVPVFRLDIEREVDLIEEVARMQGLDTVPVRETIDIRVAPPQPRELAKRAVADTLVGMGFLETVTHSLVSDRAAAAFLPPGMKTMRIDERRAAAEPALRPSILPSLLRVYTLNRDHGQADVRLFETASTFAHADEGHLETENLALLVPAGDDPQQAVRFVRGVADRLVAMLAGRDARTTVEPLEDAGVSLPWWSPGAAMRVNGEVLGTFGLLSQEVLRDAGIETDVCAAELGLPRLYEHFPPDTQAGELPSHPAIERDLSIIIDEAVQWRQVTGTLDPLDLDHLEAIDFVTTFRGRQVGPGRKSLTLRLRFRAPDRTLQHEEVDAQMAQAVAALTANLSAEIRA